MNKFLLILLVIYLNIILSNEVLAISEEFKFVINEIGIPQYNVKNMEINEDIYNVYNIFIYGSPTDVNSREQRWKSFSTGKWCYKKSVYKGTGTRGEYAVLGYNYSGDLVYNYYFPLDRVTSTPVVKWKFLEVAGALDSWKQAEKYYSKEQIDYMKNSKLWFQDITGGKNDPYDQIEYDLQVVKIGLNKARLETPATWKTVGSVYLERRTESGGVGWANFIVQPMAADAKIISNIEVREQHTLDKEKDEIIIPIKFGASVTDLTEYAKEKHIKEITSVLYYNGKEVSRISGSKITSVGNEYMLVISRDKIPQNKTYLFDLKVHSYVKTEFLGDGLLQDEKKETVTVNIEPKIIVPILQTTLNVLTKIENEWVVSPLAQNITTISSESSGLTEAGRILIIKNIIDKSKVNKNNISDVKIKINGIIQKDENVQVLDSIDDYFIVKLKLPIELDTTLYGWKSLREESLNYFKIDNTKLLKRKEEAHVLELIYNLNGKEYMEKCTFDTVDDYISNMNYDIENLLSENKLSKVFLLKELLKEKYE